MRNKDYKSNSNSFIDEKEKENEKIKQNYFTNEDDFIEYTKEIKNKNDDFNKNNIKDENFNTTIKNEFFNVENKNEIKFNDNININIDEPKIKNKEKNKKKIKKIQNGNDIKCIWIFDEIKRTKKIEEINKYFYDNLDLELEIYNINKFKEEILTTLNSSCKFKTTILILDGFEISKTIFEIIEANITYLNFLPKMIIFSEYDKNAIEFLEQYNLACFNNNNIINDLDSLKDIIFKENYIPKKRPKSKFQFDDECFYFEYINSEKELILPMLYSKLISKLLSEEIENFNKFLLDKYSDNKKIDYLINQIFSIKIELFMEIVIKYWLKIYTLESDFYVDINAYLNRNLGNDFDTYIKGLYNGLELQCINPVYDQTLFRGAKISNNEIEFIEEGLKKIKNENYPNLICYTKSFFSTNLDKKVALQIMKNKIPILGKKESLVLYEIISSSELDKSIVTNVNLSDISDFDEKEILFFPFSSFEINSIEKQMLRDNTNYYLIKLLYLGKYIQKFKEKHNVNIEDNNNNDIIEKICDIPESKFAISILQSDLFNKEEIKKEDDKKEKGKKMFNFDIQTFIPKKNPNHIIAVYDIKNEDLFKKIKIINYNNFDNSSDLFLDNIQINFNENYEFKKEGIYTFKFDFKDNKIKSLKKLFSN